MNKTVWKVKVPKNKTIEYNGAEIEIVPFITLAQQVFMINKYVEDYFGTPDDILINNSKYHYLEAEARIKSYILELCTDINMKEDVDNDIFADWLLWDIITSQITNYQDFRKTLSIIVEDMKQKEVLENSIGKVVSDIVQKGYLLLNKLSELNPDEIKKAGEEGQKLIEKLEKSSLLNNPSDKIEIMEKQDDVLLAKPVKTKKTRTKKTT